jgi:spermidine/putrescine transport system permease protein
MNSPNPKPADASPQLRGQLGGQRGERTSAGFSRRALAAYTALVYVFLYAPIVILVIFSFNAARRTATWEGFTLQWYARLAENPLIRQAVINSLKVAAVATVIATVMGAMAGLALARYRFRGRLATGILLYLPLVIPEIVLAAALLSLFGVIRMELGFWTLVIAHVVFSVSYVSIVVQARLAGMGVSLQEAAADLGAPPLAVFARVTLPQLAPALVAGALLVFTLSLDDYLISSFVAGVGNTTLPLRIYSMVKTGVTPEVNAVCTLLLLVTLVLICAAHWLLRGALGKGELS